MTSKPFATLCRFLSETDLSALPPSVIDHARQVLVDTLGVIIAGSGVPEVNPVADRLSPSCRKEEGVTCPGRAGGFEPLFAALLNGIVRDPQVMELAGRVQMGLSQEYEHLRPGRNPAKVTLHLKAGQEVTREVMDCLGDPLKPMPREDLVAKSLDLAGSVIGKDRGKEFLERVQGLESVDNVRPLLRMLRPGA